MNNLKISIIALLYAMLLIPKANAQELWAQYGVSYDVGDNMNLRLDMQNRFYNTGTFTHYKNATKLTIAYELSSYFKVSGSYRYSRIKDDLNQSNEFETDDKQRYTADLNAKLPLGKKYKLKNRSRYQVSLEDYNDAKKYYRNKTTFEIRIDKKTEFFIAREYFFRLDKEKKPLTRMSYGFERKIFNDLTIKPFFHIEKKKFEKSSERNYIIGSSLCFQLN